MKKKILFVGYGSIAKKHIRILNKLKKYEIFIISNSYFGKNKLSIKEAKKIEFQYCFICSPASHRLNYLKYLINSSNNFFLEKPISHNYKNALKLKKKIISKKIYVGYVFRHNKIITKAKKIIEKMKNEITSVQIISSSFLPTWRNGTSYKKSVSSQKKLGGGVLNELSHEIDICFYLFGNISLQYGSFYNSKSLKINVEEMSNIILEINNKIPINLFLNFNSHLRDRRVVINFKKKTLELNLNKNLMKIFSNAKEIKRIYFKRENKIMFSSQISNFLSGKKLNDSYKESLKTLKIIDEIKKN